MAMVRRTAIEVHDASVTGAVKAVEIETASIETGALAAAAIGVHPARMGETPRKARLAVTRVGAEAGAVILTADTHVVIEEMETIIGAATVDDLAPALRRDTTALEVRTAGTAGTATIGAIVAGTMTAMAAVVDDTALPRSLHLRS
jgi:hypothetical protein